MVMMMGKKKAQKTKELSVAIAEASSAGEESGQPQAARKRGRPRKMVEKTEIISPEKQQQETERETVEEAAVEEAEISITGSSLKKAKSSELGEEEQQQHVEGSSVAIACTRFTIDSKAQPSRSRARRKSKPRKST